MANLFFPQLASGALTQYPIRKSRVGRTLQNILPDGSVILASDRSATRLIWQLAYTGLASEDMDALSAHFEACQGRLRSFTFLDPTNNLLTSSSNLSEQPWQADSSLSLTGQVLDGAGDITAVVLTNNGQADAGITQPLNIPAGYQYCFSIYARSAAPATFSLVRSGPGSVETEKFQTTSNWHRYVSSGKLNDTGTLRVAIRAPAGQQIVLYGPQLEAQIAPSSYRPTFQTGGVYSNAHFGMDELPYSADAPNQFSTMFSIEAAI